MSGGPPQQGKFFKPWIIDLDQGPVAAHASDQHSITTIVKLGLK